VVKAAFGLAGQSAVRLWEPEILPSQRRWIELATQQGRAVLVEPWLDRRIDFSVQLEMEPRGLRLRGFTGLLNDHRGQYQGNWIDADHGHRIPVAVLAQLRAAGAPGNWAMQLYQELWPALEAELRTIGFLGPLGVDAFLFSRPDGSVALKPIVEINPRHTMGRLAWELMAHVRPGVPGQFRLLNKSHLRSLGAGSFQELAEIWTHQFPPLRVGEPVPQLSEGIVFLNDPMTAQSCLAVLAVGSTAQRLAADDHRAT
jgi:hypothetical protein